MNRLRAPITLLTCTAVLACSTAQAQARSSSTQAARNKEQEKAKVEETFDDATRDRKLAELDAWLRRLTGRFRIEGDVITKPLAAGTRPAGASSKAHGVADCAGIGAGSGVQCVVNAIWSPIPDLSGLSNLPYNNSMRPMVILIGLDPTTGGAHIMLANDHAQWWPATFDDDTLSSSDQAFQSCDLSLTHCWHGVRIAAKPKLDFITLTIGKTYEVTLRLHRDPQLQNEKGSRATPK